jgi:hypothetical protein
LIPAEWNIGDAVKVLAETTPPAPPAVPHQKTPASVRAVYMSQCVVGTPTFRANLVSLIEKTDLNALVIDIKDFSGTISFPTKDPLFAEASLVSCGARDMEAFLKELHLKGIYVIGRITVFQDPFYTKQHPELAVQSVSKPGTPWKDRKGLSFIDVSSRPFWDYIVTLSKESYAIGFDELNYDYIRYPSDGVMADASYVNPNKQETLETFFKYLHERVAPTGVAMSADLFGYVTVHTDDLGIGQVLERALPYFDYIDPMVYPSHYNNGFAGLKNVNSDPYTVVNVSLVEAVRRAVATSTVVAALAHTPIMKTVVVPGSAGTATTTKEVPTGLYAKTSYPPSVIRPWLQSFDYPVPYTAGMVAAQIKANDDAGLSSYLFWDPANKYLSLQSALAPENGQQ